MNVDSIKHFITEMQGIDETQEYITCENEHFSRTHSKVQKSLNTSKIIAVVERIVASLATLELTDFEKAKICSGLEGSLKAYCNRILTHRTMLYKVLVTLRCVPDRQLEELKSQCSMIRERLKSYPVSTQQQEPQEATKQPFTKKFQRAESFDPTHPDFGQTVVRSVLNTLKQDPTMEWILNTWYAQAKGGTSATMTSLMAEDLRGGTCYGQAMKILELLDSKDRKEITEEYIRQNMVLRDYVRYQILHHLNVFILNEKSAYIYGKPKNDIEEQIARYLPHYDKRGKSSETLNLYRFEKETLFQRLSDFIKGDIRSTEATSSKRDYVIEIALSSDHKSFGHAAIVHYSETRKTYFWYDPYCKDYGLYSSTDHKEFLKGVAAKLLEYKNKKVFERVYFTAYRI